jgi:hypothetical protein
MLVIKENEIKHFSFGVEVKGSTESPIARLVFESNGNNKMFPVHIEDGAYRYSLSYDKLKDLREGNVYLEVLIGKNYFQPWKDTFTLVGSTIQESVEKPAIEPKVEQKKIITESKQKQIKAKPSFDTLRREYKNLLKQGGIMFLEGESPRNFQIKKKTLVMLENKYGRQVRKDLLKLNSIKIDELLIF